MDDSKVFMFPDAAKSTLDPNLLLALQNNGGFGGGAGFYWIFFLWMMWTQNGRNGNFNDYVATMNGNEGRQYLAEIMNGRFDNLGQLAQIVNTGVETVKSGIFAVQNSISQLGAQVGMSGLQVQNAIAQGNAALAQQLCSCCCENRLAIVNQTNTLQAQAAGNFAASQLQSAQNQAATQLQMAQIESADQLAVCQQTNALSSQAERNTNSILNAINAQTVAMDNQFCQLKERELQSKIDTQSDIITQLRGQISNDKQTEVFTAAFNQLNDKINTIANRQPNTIPVQWPNIQAVSTTPWIGNYWGGGQSYWG